MEKQVTDTRQLENKRLLGLNIARSLNFTDEQYEMAIKRIDTPDNANQLLIALLDVSATDAITKQCAPDEIEVAKSNGNNNGITTNSGFQVRARATATNSCETTTSSSSSTTSLSTQATSGFISSENQSLECLAIQQQQQHPLHSNNHHQQQDNYYNQQQIQHNNFQRQKLQRSRSHQPTTSTIIGCAPSDLRLIYIDGPNVARTHGKDVTFSWPGIKLCVDWFRRRNHRVKVFVPEDKCDMLHGCLPTAASVINYLNQIDALIKTPIGCNDDMFVIAAAKEKDGVVVSNDLYRNEKRSNNELRKFINLNRLPYIFDDDHFIPARDPLGRFGPSLDEFLRFDKTTALVSHQVHKQSVHRTKSHQRQ